VPPKQHDPARLASGWRPVHHGLALVSVGAMLHVIWAGIGLVASVLFSSQVRLPFFGGRYWLFAGLGLMLTLVGRWLCCAILDTWAKAVGIGAAIGSTVLLLAWFIFVITEAASGGNVSPEGSPADVLMVVGLLLAGLVSLGGEVLFLLFLHRLSVLLQYPALRNSVAGYGFTAALIGLVGFYFACDGFPTLAAGAGLSRGFAIALGLAIWYYAMIEGARTAIGAVIKRARAERKRMEAGM